MRFLIITKRSLHLCLFTLTRIIFSLSAPLILKRRQMFIRSNNGFNYVIIPGLVLLFATTAASSYRTNYPFNVTNDVLSVVIGLHYPYSNPATPHKLLDCPLHWLFIVSIDSHLSTLVAVAAVMPRDHVAGLIIMYVVTCVLSGKRWIM